jgi:replicative superfamily II helicase
MEDFAARVQRAYGGNYMESSIKGAYVYNCLLNGLNLGPFAAMARGLQLDYERLSTVLNMLDSMAAKWNKRDYFRDVELRVAYGVRPELVELCRLPGIGRVRAERLNAAGFKRPGDLLKNPVLVKKILNMKEEKVLEILKSIRSVS